MARTILSIVLLFSGSWSSAWAEDRPPKYREGKGFELIQPVQPTRDPDKVEVIEFFWYGCPHCFRFEPHLNEWLKKLPDNVQYIRQPAILGARWAMHAKAYFTAEALGVVDKVHADLFDTIQNKKQPLKSEDELATFFAGHGITDKEFRQAFNSFIVDSKMRQAGALSARYGITGVPTVVVEGKYRIGGSAVKGFNDMINVMDFLIAKKSAAAQ